MSALDIIHDTAKQSRDTGGEKFNPYRNGTPEFLAYECGWEGEATLYTRQDGQVFIIESLGGGEFQAGVPSDLAEQGEGAVYESLEGAYHYLQELLVSA